MKQYHELLREILVNGDIQYEPRTQEYVIGLSGQQSHYNLRDGFPLMTTKRVPFRLVSEELFWKLRGERNVKPLFDRDVHIWDENAFQHHLTRKSLTSQFPKHSQVWEEEFVRYKEKLAKDPAFAEEGDLGPVYGFQWRHWRSNNGKEVDQLEKVLSGIKGKPGSRYHLMSSWNPGDLDDMALGPCPMLHHFNIWGNNLDLNMYQRSCDVFLGVPFNIAQDSLLTHLIANETDLNTRKFIHTYGNVHAYLGVPPRAEFWTNPENVKIFQSKVKSIDNKEGYLEVRDWYLRQAPPEEKVNERKDHIPFILEQLSKEPRTLPTISIADIPLIDAINRPADTVISVDDYNPHKWDSKARMAA